MFLEEAAEREVFEEAGVLGRLGRLLGVFEVHARQRERAFFFSSYIYIEWKLFLFLFFVPIIVEKRTTLIT